MMSKMMSKMMSEFWEKIAVGIADLRRCHVGTIRSIDVVRDTDRRRILSKKRSSFAGHFCCVGAWRAHGASRCEAEERERGAASVRRAFVCATAFP